MTPHCNRQKKMSIKGKIRVVIVPGNGGGEVYDSNWFVRSCCSLGLLPWKLRRHKTGMPPKFTLSEAVEAVYPLCCVLTTRTRNPQPTTHHSPLTAHQASHLWARASAVWPVAAWLGTLARSSRCSDR
jgi:hypothetical protein